MVQPSRIDAQPQLWLHASRDDALLHDRDQAKPVLPYRISQNSLGRQDIVLEHKVDLTKKSTVCIREATEEILDKPGKGAFEDETIAREEYFACLVIDSLVYVKELCRYTMTATYVEYGVCWFLRGFPVLFAYTSVAVESAFNAVLPNVQSVA